MSVNGVSDSPLLERAVYGDQSRVPIGTPVITNNKLKNSKEIQLLITGADLTEPMLNHFESFGYDGKEAFRESKSNSINFRDRQNVNDRLVIEWAYDVDTGSLVLVRSNKEELRIDGLLRQADFGIGATGPRGLPGRDGKDGFDGFDGKDGQAGCPGEQGPIGDIGTPGREGNPGIIGLQGPDGCEGSTGDRGVMGPQGVNGFEGSRGLTGPSCGDDKIGAVGSTGAAFGQGVLFGLASLANPLAAIVGLDDDGIDAIAPAGGWDGSSRPPPTSTPAVPPPQPVGVARVSLCESNAMFGDVTSSCGSNVKWWGTSWSNYAGPNGTRGLSTLPRPNQVTQWWPHSLVMCGYLEKGATYTIELTTPNGVASSLFVNCSIVAQTDYPGGTTRVTVTPERNSGLRVRFLSNSIKIPFWFAIRILDSSGTVLYRTGQNQKNAGLSPNPPYSMDAPTYMTDPNWRSNSTTQQYN